MTATTPQGQINAPDQLDCMSTLRTDNSQTLVNALAEIDRLRVQLAGCGVAAMQNTESSKADRAVQGDYGYSVSYADVCRAVDREIALRDEIERLKGLLATDSTSTLNDAMFEIECLRKANLNCVAHYDDARAECERHIQEVDASREAIERQSAALRVAASALIDAGMYARKYGDELLNVREALATIKEAL